MNNNKVKKDLLKEYISFLPKDYKIDNEAAKKVFAVLFWYSHQNDHQPFTIGQRQLAEETMLSLMTVNRAVNLLTEKYNYVNYQKGHLKVNSTYQILSPSIETSIVPQMIKNDMVQREEMVQQNGTIKMIFDGTINPTDNEEVICTKVDQNGTVPNTLGNFDEMVHKYKLKYNLKYNTNSNNSNKHMSNISLKEKVEKENSTLLEEKLLERIEVMENNQEKMATLLERLMEKTNLPTSTLEEKKNEEIEGLKAKVYQLEETVENQAREITHLNERIDKAGKAFLELRNSIKSTSTQVEEKTTYTTQPTYSTNVDNSYNKEKGEYVKAIKAFYEFKRENKLEECQKMVETLQKLAQTGKLTEYQLEKIEKCEEILGESERIMRGWQDPLKYGYNGRMNFSAYQSKFYDILKKENFSEEDFKELTDVVKKIEVFDHIPKDKFNKIVEIYANTMAKDTERKKVYFTEYYAYRNAFRTMLQKGDDAELIYKLCQKYAEYLLTLRQVPREILRKAGMEEVLLYSKGCWSDEAIRWKWNYEQKASTNLQKEESGITDHTEEENVSEGLKTAKNEVLTDVNTTEISENKVEEPETTKEEVKTEVTEKASTSLENVEGGTTTHADQESLSEGLKSGKNKELTSVNPAYNPPIRIEEGRSTLFVPLNSNVSEDDLIAKMLGNR